MSIKKRTLRIVPDVVMGEKLHFDNRLADPSIVFGGFVVEQPPQSLLLPEGSQQPVVQRAVFHAVFLVPDHLFRDERATKVKRIRGEESVVVDLAENVFDEPDEPVSAPVSGG